MHTAELPLVAIVVLNWNRPEDTAECLASVRALEYPRVLPLLVDNGSTDDSIERLRGGFPECTVLANPRNLGYAEGNNVGIRHALSAGADYVLLLNNDATIGRDALGRLVAAAEADPSLGVLGPRIYFWDRPELVWFAGGEVDPASLEPRHLGEMQNRPADTGRITEVGYVSGCALMTRSALFRGIGLLDPDYYLLFEETDFCARARKAGYRVVLVPEAAAWHKVSSSFGGRSSLSYLYYLHRNNLIYVRKRMEGRERWAAYLRVLRRQLHYVWQLYRRGQPEAGLHGRVVARAVGDFLLGRYGEGPAWLRSVGG